VNRGSQGDLVFVALHLAVWVLKRPGSVEADGKAECVGLADDTAHGRFGIQSGEVVAAEIGVVDIVGKHVPYRDQDRCWMATMAFFLPSRCAKR
jgi:hypothetical protein